MTAMARVRVRIGWASTGMMDEAVMASVQVTFLQAQHRQRAAGDEMRVVGGNQHGRAETVELLEEVEEAGGKGGINIARRLIGEEEFRLCHNGTAMATRCFSPPERTGGNISAWPLSPTQSRSSFTLER